MKMIIIILALVALVAAAPVDEKEPPKILRAEFDQQPQGSYVYSFETENGISRSETGELKEVLDEENKPHSVIIVRGSYSYINSEGKQDTITYVADETGFHPEGESIPKPASRR
ncbi:unnamed protein product, partial [Brenthis ino]